MSEPLLSIEDLRVSFRTYEGLARVLNGVSLHIDKGEAVAVVGETGCGKSVTAKAVVGLLPVPPAQVDGGAVRFRGRDLLRLDERGWAQVRGQQISMVFQDPMTHLNPVCTVGEHLMDVVLWSGRTRTNPLRLVDRRRRRQAREQAIEWLHRVRLPDPERTLDRYPVELSGGMRQRVLIALGLITGPQLLIADEPGTALDVSIQDQILELLEELIARQGTSLLFITHNLGVARRIARRIYVMYAGEAAETGPTQQVFEQPQHPYTRGLLDSLPKLTGEMGSGIEGRIPDFVKPPPGCRFAPRCPYRMARCEGEKPPLYEVAPGHRVACFLFDQDAQPVAAAPPGGEVSAP